MQIMYFIPFVVVAVLMAVIYGFREISQWKRVVDISSPAFSPQRHEISYLNNAIINGFQFNGTMKIGVGDERLFLQPIFPFSMAMAPVYIPLKLLKPLNKTVNGLHIYAIEGTNLTLGISERWRERVGPWNVEI